MHILTPTSHSPPPPKRKKKGSFTEYLAFLIWTEEQGRSILSFVHFELKGLSRAGSIVLNTSYLFLGKHAAFRIKATSACYIQKLVISIPKKSLKRKFNIKKTVHNHDLL